MVPIIMNNNHNPKTILPGKIYIVCTITKQRISTPTNPVCIDNGSYTNEHFACKITSNMR